MAASEVTNQQFLDIDDDSFNEELCKVVDSLLPKYDSLVKRHATIDLIFTSLLAIELGTLIFCFHWLLNGSIFAFALALFFLTLFGYLMVRSYTQGRKPEEFVDFKKRFIRGCKQIAHFRDGIAEHHLALAHVCCRLALALQGRESTYFEPPRWLRAIASTLERVSRWYFWVDLLTMRELLLECSVHQHVQLVKCEPTSLDAHAALANAYVMLSGLYDAVKNGAGQLSESLITEAERKFRLTAEKAIEEFKILNAYAPNDPWVHMQLAYSYRDLKMPREEIGEYEVLLRLRPNDQQTLFKLGRLYFSQGMNAQGLRIYEHLKQTSFKQAEELITYYGS